MSKNASIWRIDVASRDADFISSEITRAYAPCKAVPSILTSPLGLKSIIVGNENFSISKNSISNVAYQTEGDGDFVLCFIPFSGNLKIESGSSVLDDDSNQIIFCNAKPIKTLAFSEGRSEITYAANSRVVCDYLSSYIGSNVYELSDFRYLIDKKSHIGSAFINYSSIIMDYIEDVDSFSNSPIQMKRCQDAFISLSMASISVDQLVKVGSRSVSIGLNFVRRAEDYMHANRKLPIGVNEVANHLGVTLRVLQYSFKRYRQVTPLWTLTRYRLEGLRDELRTGGDGNISQMAAKWGFANTSRLSAAYRSAFGESPRETLKRGRSERETRSGRPLC